MGGLSPLCDPPRAGRRAGRSVVVLGAEVGDGVVALEVAERVLQLHELDEDVVLGVDARRRRLRALPVEAQPLLDARQAGPLGQVEEQGQVEHQRGGEDRVPAEEVDLDLHLVAEPPEDVDVVPALLVVAAGRVVVDAHHVVDVAVEVGVALGLEDGVEHAELRHLLGLERLRVVEDLAVAVAEDVGGVPALDAEHAGLEAGGEDGLHQGLAGLEVLAGDRHVVGRASSSSAGVSRLRLGAPLAIGMPQLQQGVGVDLAGGDVGVGVAQALLERLEALVDGGGLAVHLGGAAPHGDQAVAAVAPR